MNEKIVTQLIVFAMLVTALITDSPALSDFLVPPPTADGAAAATAPGRRRITFERGPDMSNALTTEQANAAWDRYIARNIQTDSN